MRINNINEINDFLCAVKQCSGNVYLTSPEGDKFNLKSEFSQYIALGALLGDKGDYLELFCDNKADETYFFNFFNNHPDIN